MSPPALSHPALSRQEALRELDLDGSPPGGAISVAFRRKARAINAEVTSADMDAALRRLIEARERLMADFSLQAPLYDRIEKPAIDPATSLSISLTEAVRGGSVVCTLFEDTQPYPEHIRSRTPVTVHLKPGLRHGECARLSTSHGNEQLFRIEIACSENARVFGNDIWMQADIDAGLLRTGGKICLDTPHGPVPVSLEPELVAGSCLTLPQLGLPATESHPAGRLYVRIASKAVPVRPYDELASAFRTRWVAKAQA